MNNIPLVSVIILAYNHERFISKALDSVIRQERSFPVEILINDDASLDSTPDIIRDYENRYPDLIFFFPHSINQGAMKSFYFIQDKCKGKYIMACAGDDYWLPGKMKLQVEYMETHSEVGMCYGKVKRLYNENFLKSLGDRGGEIFEEILFRNPIPAVTVCRRADMSKLYMDEIHPEQKEWVMDDLPMWLWFSKNSRISYIDKELSVYRIVQGSISHPISLEKKLYYATSHNNVLKYFTKNEPSYRKRINREYEHTVANAYLADGDIREYRIHNKKSGGLPELIKNLISYIPGGIKYLKGRLKW